MKSLHDYIIQEKLHLNKDTKVSITDGEFSVDFPKVNIEDYEVQDEIWKEMTFPYKKWVIFNDKYRGDRMHFAELMDMLIGIAWAQDDYEDFDPKEDILYSSDDFDDIFKWYCKELKIDINSLKRLSEDEINNEIRKNSNYKWAVDDIEFFTNIITGVWNEKTFSEYHIDPSNDFKDELKKYIA